MLHQKDAAEKLSIKKKKADCICIFPANSHHYLQELF